VNESASRTSSHHLYAEPSPSFDRNSTREASTATSDKYLHTSVAPSIPGENAGASALEEAHEAYARDRASTPPSQRSLCTDAPRHCLRVHQCLTMREPDPAAARIALSHHALSWGSLRCGLCSHGRIAAALACA
jgi:hypothetical protein